MEDVIVHCDKHCTRPPNHGWGKCVGPDEEQWHRKCPRCAEVERIDAWCDVQAERVRSERSYYDDDRDARADCYDYAAEFARGKT